MTVARGGQALLRHTDPRVRLDVAATLWLERPAVDRGSCGLCIFPAGDQFVILVCRFLEDEVPILLLGLVASIIEA